MDHGNLAPEQLTRKTIVIFFNVKPASKTARTNKLWGYDFNTNVHKTLKQNRLTKSDFDEFIWLYSAEDRCKREVPYSGSPLPEGEVESRWRSFTYDELIARDKTNLEIFWFKDQSLEDTENLPHPEVLAQEIVEQLQTTLNKFRSVEGILSVNDD